jgi:hypothetical protein
VHLDVELSRDPSEGNEDRAECMRKQGGARCSERE